MTMRLNRLPFLLFLALFSFSCQPNGTNHRIVKTEYILGNESWAVDTVNEIQRAILEDVREFSEGNSPYRFYGHWSRVLPHGDATLLASAVFWLSKEDVPYSVIFYYNSKVYCEYVLTEGEREKLRIMLEDSYYQQLGVEVVLNSMANMGISGNELNVRLEWTQK